MKKIFLLFVAAMLFLAAHNSEGCESFDTLRVPSRCALAVSATVNEISVLKGDQVIYLSMVLEDENGDWYLLKDRRMLTETQTVIKIKNERLMKFGKKGLEEVKWSKKLKFKELLFLDVSTVNTDECRIVKYENWKYEL